MAQRPKEDIRVRLSAEGQEEVVAAFRRVQAQAEASGKAGAKGFAALGNAASRLGALLPALGFAAVTAGLVRVPDSVFRMRPR